MNIDVSRLQKGHYGTVSEVAGDLNILFENAKKVNKPDTKLYKVCRRIFRKDESFLFRCSNLVFSVFHRMLLSCRK